MQELWDYEKVKIVMAVDRPQFKTLLKSINNEITESTGILISLQLMDHTYCDASLHCITVSCFKLDRMQWCQLVHSLHIVISQI